MNYFFQNICQEAADECGCDVDVFKDRLGINGKYRDNDYERWSWDQIFMSIAYTVACRSSDANTQHGCVIVDDKNHIVATGFNGFPPGAFDEELPNIRDDGHKYRYIVHAELNAVLQSTQSDLSTCRAYITGAPCNECLKVLISKGIKEIIIGDIGHVTDETYDNLHSFLTKMHGVQVKHFRGMIADTRNLRHIGQVDGESDTTN